MYLTACFLATGDLSFYYCFKMHVWSTTGPALVVPDILYSDTCSLKKIKIMYAIKACQKYSFIRI